MFCPKCGNSLKEDEKYCPSCGAEQHSTSAKVSTDSTEQTKPKSSSMGSLAYYGIPALLGVVIVCFGAYQVIGEQNAAEGIAAETEKIKYRNERLKAELHGVSSATPDRLVMEMCHERLGKVAKYQVEIVSTEIDRSKRNVTGIAKYQNGFGAWASKSYRCHMAAPRTIYIHLDGELVATFDTLID
jgi:DNA-directed RNA polymerase subunit M/transcription elongation factor TFIIS